MIFLTRCVSILFVSILSVTNLAKAQSKPNIVFIYTDDQAYYTIHALGNKEIETPNLDRLARMGKSFTNAYNMGAWHGAVCVASRSMIITGRTIWNVKKLEHKLPSFSEATWPKMMERAGYETYMTGKWHINMEPTKVFQHVTNVTPGMLPYGTPENAKLPGFVSNKNFNTPGYNRPKSANDDTWSPSDERFGGYWENGTHQSVVFKKNSISHIEAAAKQEKPFFLYLASNAPHDPRQSPKEYVDKYPLNGISMPKSWLPENPYKDSIGNDASLRDEALAPFPRTELAIKTHLQEYYAAVTFLDKQIGEVLDALEATGKMNNTYIFFTSDHGLALGRHGFMGKQTLFEHSMKPPLIVAGPGIAPNTISEMPVYLQDIMATSLELANAEKLNAVEFQSFLNVAKGTSGKRIHEAIYGGYMNLQRSVRVGDHKLILFPKINKILLFDLKKDPEEMHNLADDKKYKSTAKQLFTALLKEQKKLNDPLDITNMAELL